MVKLLILLCEIVQQLGRRFLCICDGSPPPVIFLTVRDEQLTELASLCKSCCGKKVHNVSLSIYTYMPIVCLFANEMFYRKARCKHTTVGKHDLCEQKRRDVRCVAIQIHRHWESCGWSFSTLLGKWYKVLIYQAFFSGLQRLCVLWDTQVPCWYGWCEAS